MKTAVYMRPYWRAPRIGTGQTCPVCGAQFWPSDDCGCKYGQTNVCSQPCMKEMAARDKARKLAKIKETKQYKAWKMHEAGMTREAIAAAFGAPKYKTDWYIGNFMDVHRDLLDELREETA